MLTPETTISAAVQRCCDAYNAAAAEEKTKEYFKQDLNHPCEAYRQRIPILSDRDSIRAFIACVTHGMLIGAIDMSDGSRLLYAAQVARSALPREQAETRPVGRPHKSQPAPEPMPDKPQPSEPAPQPNPQPENKYPTPSPAASTAATPPPGNRGAISQSQPSSTPGNKYPTPPPTSGSPGLRAPGNLTPQ